MDKSYIYVHTDGGSRGNPGPAACAFVVEDGKTVLNEASKYLGKVTNNYAEYSGVILALDWLIAEDTSLLKKDVIFYLDSELVVKQINGLYRVKDETLRNLFFEVSTKIKNINVKVTFQHVPREKNQAADLLVNQELDSHS